MSPRSEKDILRDIVSVTQAFARSTRNPLNSQRQAAALTGIRDEAEYTFPTPQPLTDKLVAIGVNQTIASRVSEAYIRTAQRSKLVIETRYRRAFAARRQLPSGPMEDPRLQTLWRDVAIENPNLQELWRKAHLATYTRTLQYWADLIMKQYAPRLLQKQQGQSTLVFKFDQTVARTPFNQDAVPLLVDFFERNAFPSRKEREELALRTGMESKQINIWFQNRRARSKKVVSDLKEESSMPGLPSDLEATFAKILSEDIEECNRPDTEQESPSQSSNADNPDPLLFSLRPAHAYPSSYPPACSYDPFPVLDRQRCRLPTPWPRTATRKYARGPLPVDITELTKMFSRLDLKGRMSDDSKRATRVSPRASGWRPSMPMPIGFVTHAPRAPLHRATPICDRVAAPQAMCGLSQRRGKTPSELGYSAQSSSPKLLGTSVLDSTKASDRDNTLSRKSSRSSYRTLPYPPVSLPGPHPSARVISPLSQKRHMAAFFAYASTPVTLLGPVPSSVTAEPVLESIESYRVALTRKVIDRKPALYSHAPYPLPKDSQSKIDVAARRTPSPFDHSSPLTSPALIDSPLSSVGFVRAPSVTPSISSMDSDSPPTPVLPFAQLDESISSGPMAGSTSPQSADFLSAWLSLPDDEPTLDLFPTLDFKEPLFDPKFYFEKSNVDFKQLRLGHEVFPRPVIVEVPDGGVLSSPSLTWSI